MGLKTSQSYKHNPLLSAIYLIPLHAGLNQGRGELQFELRLDYGIEAGKNYSKPSLVFLEVLISVQLED